MKTKGNVVRFLIMLIAFGSFSLTCLGQASVDVENIRQRIVLVDQNIDYLMNQKKPLDQNLEPNMQEAFTQAQLNQMAADRMSLNGKLQAELDTKQKLVAELKTIDAKLNTERATLTPGDKETIDAQVAQESDCGKSTKDANVGCNPQQNPGLTSAIGMADKVSGPGGLTAMAGPEGACGTMGSVMGAVNAGLLGYKGYCSAKYFSCSSACKDDLVKANDKKKEARDAVAAAKKKLAPANAEELAAAERAYSEASYRVTAMTKTEISCQQNASNLAGAVTNIMSIVQQMIASKQCENAAMNSIAEICKKMPQMAVCTSAKPVDCNDPQARATNVVCICMTNPSDSRCGSGGIDIALGGGRGNGRNGSGTDNAAGGAAPGGLALDSSSFDGGMGSVAAGKGAEGKSGQMGGGAGGSKSGLSGDTGSAKGPAAGGKDPRDTKINAGYYGGGGGGGSYSSGKGYSGSGSYGSNNYPSNSNFDLKPYLPNGKPDSNRGLASAGPDGLTGPNTNIWAKVKARYFTVSPSLLP